MSPRRHNGPNRFGTIRSQKIYNFSDGEKIRVLLGAGKSEREVGATVAGSPLRTPLRSRLQEKFSMNTIWVLIDGETEPRDISLERVLPPSVPDAGSVRG